MPNRIVVPFDWGEIVSEVGGDPDHPSVYTFFRRPDGVEIDICYVEFKDTHDRLSAYIWSDTSTDSWTKRFDYSKDELMIDEP